MLNGNIGLEARAAPEGFGIAHAPGDFLRFPSNAKPPVPLEEFVDSTLSSIVGPVLISAYDLYYEPRIQKFDFQHKIVEAAPLFVLMDSGRL